MRIWFDSKNVAAISTFGVLIARLFCFVSFTCDMEKWHLGGKLIAAVTGSIPVVATKNTAMECNESPH